MENCEEISVSINCSKSLPEQYWLVMNMTIRMTKDGGKVNKVCGVNRVRCVSLKEEPQKLHKRVN